MYVGFDLRIGVARTGGDQGGGHRDIGMEYDPIQAAIALKALEQEKGDSCCPLFFVLARLLR